MKDAFWRGVSYVGFLGLFTHLYGRGEVARHGRRGFVVFIWELIALVLVDVIRVKLGWPLSIFVPVLGMLAVFKVVLIVRAVNEKRAGTERITP
jgi:hypothetical protein